MTQIIQTQEEIEINKNFKKKLNVLIKKQQKILLGSLNKIWKLSKTQKNLIAQITENDRKIPTSTNHKSSGN